MTTGKTIALTRQIFVSKVMSLLFNKSSRLGMTFLPRSKSLNFMAPEYKGEQLVLFKERIITHYKRIKLLN